MEEKAVQGDAELEVAIGRAVFRYRTEHGWSQRELASKMRGEDWPWTQTVVARVERAERPIRLAEATALAGLFEIALTSLVTNPLDAALSEVRSERLRAQTAFHQTTGLLSVLEALSTATSGHPASIQDPPELTLIWTFPTSQFPWPKTREVFAYAGVPPEDLAELDDLYDLMATESGNSLRMGKKMWQALQKALPMLTTDSE